MPRFGPFSACVEIDGFPVPEFDVSTEGRTVVCSIPCEIGKTFSVAWTNLSWKQPTAGHIFVDGVESGGRVVDGPSTVAARHEGLTDCATMRRFKFAAIRLGSSSISLPEKLGQINLAIYPCQSGNQILASYENMSVLGLPDAVFDDPLCNRPQIKFGQIERLPIPQFAVSHRLLGPPIVEFCFKYRPLGVIQALRIAPPGLSLDRREDARVNPRPTKLSEASHRTSSPLPPSSPPSSSPPIFSSAAQSDSCTEYSEEPSRCSDEDTENIDPNPKARHRNPIPRSQPTAILCDSRDNATIGPSAPNMLSFEDCSDVSLLLCLADNHPISVPTVDEVAYNPVLWSKRDPLHLSSYLTVRSLHTDAERPSARSPIAKPVRPISPGTLLALTEPVLMAWVKDLPDLASLAVDR